MEEGSGRPEGYIDIVVICEKEPFNQDGISAEELYKSLETNRSTSNTYDIHGEVTKYIFNGLNAKKGKHGVSEVKEVVWVLKDSYLCEIRVGTPNKFEETVVKNILSTFKFLD